MEEVQKDAVVTVSLEQGFERLSRIASLLCGVPFATITLLDKNNKPIPPTQLFDDEGTQAYLAFCDEVIQTKAVVLIEDARKNVRFAQNYLVIAKQNPICFYAGYPLICPEGTVIGVLSVLGNTPKQLDNYQKSALKSLTEEVVSRLTSNISFENYDSLIHYTPDLIGVLNFEGKYIKINPSFTKVLGWSEEELLGKQFITFSHLTDLEKSQEVIHRVSSFITNIHFSNQYKTKSGTYKSIDWFVFSNISANTISVIGRDVTQIKQTEIDILSLKEILDTSNNLSKVGAWEFDLVAKTLNWTNATREIYEVSAYFKPSLSKGISFFSIGKSKTIISQALKKAIKYGEPFDIEVQIITEKQTTKWIRATGKSTFVENKCVKISGTFEEIESSKMPRKNLSKSYERFRKIFDNAAHGMFLANLNSGAFIEVNESFAKITGFSIQELLKINIRDLIFSGDLPYSDEQFSKLLSGDLSVITLQKRYNNKQGNQVWIELVATLVRDEQGKPQNIIGQVQDITAKKTWERKLLLSEEKHRGFFENSQGIMCTHDLEGRFQTINPAGAEFLGYSTSEFLQLSLFDITPQNTHDKTRAYLEKIITKGAYKGLVKVEHKNGTYKTWLYSGVLSEFLDGKKYVIGNAVDVTERIKMERELINAKVLAERNAHAKDVFLTNMSHEIRTPMNAITGFANLLRETKLSPEQEEFVTNINTAAENLLSIINDILDLSKIESGHLVIEEVPFNVRELIRNVKSVLAFKALEKNLDLNVQIEQAIPETLMGDPTRLNQILLNITNNAIKFTEEGSVQIIVETLNESPFDYTILFKVIDTGVGIPEHKLKLIFERFTQANADTTRKYGGTGLGLSISKLLIELQKGKIWVASKLGEGSVFFFHLTFKKQVQKLINKPVETHLLPINPSKEVRILLVEDNPLNQKLAMRVLQNFGFIPELAENGKIAFDKVQVNDYDVILMDLQMPVMDGYQATAMIRQRLKKKTPIIALTAHSLIGEREKCINAGMNDYITKPFAPKNLFNKIASFINSVEETVKE